jgi:hypothetical protein
MIKLMNLKTRSVRHILSIGLGAATLAVVLTYVLGAQALLQTPQAEEGHNLFMSIYAPLIQAITGQSMGSQMQGGPQMHGGPASDSQMQGGPQMHGGPASDSQMQGGPQMHGGPASDSQMQGGMNLGLIGNNILGSPKTLPAGGLAVNVVAGAIIFAIAAFVISRKQRSYLVAGLLAASGIILMILPLANMNFMIPGPIIGVIVGLVILGLGVVKGIRTARAVTVAPR